VPRRQQVAVARGVEQLLHLLEVQALGQALVLLGRADRRERVDADEAAAGEELVKAPQRRQLPRRRALGVVLAVQVRQELADRQRLAGELLLIQFLRR